MIMIYEADKQLSLQIKQKEKEKGTIQFNNSSTGISVTSI
jgi:hypothetical protein